MAEAGGSMATWQVLLLVQSSQWDTQSKLAEAMGVTPATLTHHLNALERQGLVRRWREEGNRRVQRVELTQEGSTSSSASASSQRVTTSVCAPVSATRRSRSSVSCSTGSLPVSPSPT